MKVIKKSIALISLMMVVQLYCYAQYHIDGPGTEACFDKVKQSNTVKEAIAELGFNMSDITMGYISSRDYDCYGKNILICDGDIFIGHVSLTTPKDKEGVYYKGMCDVYYRRLNSFCNLQPTFTFERVTMFPFQAFGKKASIKDETIANEILKNAFTIPSIITINPVPINDYGLVKIDEVKFDKMASNCTQTTSSTYPDIIEKSEGTADGGQKLVYTAMFTVAHYNPNKDIILSMEKYRVLINLLLDSKNNPVEMIIIELICEDLPKYDPASLIFSGDYSNPYDSLYANYTDHGIDAVWGKFTQIAIPFSSNLYGRRLFKELTVQLALLSDDKDKNREILSPYVDAQVLDQWLLCLEAATNKKLQIKVEPDVNDYSFFISYTNKRGDRMGFSSFGLGSDFSTETGKFNRELKCQMN
jgi:hypothetical protein